jgi:hypothetical protein
MEKFIVWFGSRKEEDFNPATRVLNRVPDEIKEFFQFGFASLLTFRLPSNTIIKKNWGSKIIILIGEITPQNNWTYAKDDNSNAKNIPNFVGNGLVLIFDPENESVEVFVEPWGRRVVYHTLGDFPFLISNEMKGIIALKREIASMNNIDEKSLATMIGLHQCFGLGTIFKNIKLLKSGTTTKFSNMEKSPFTVSEFSYFTSYKPGKSVEDLTNEFSTALRTIMQDQVENKKMTSLFLSGGMDSGLLLCSLPEHLRENFRCVNFGNTKATDVKRANTLVKLVGGKYCFYHLLPKHVSNNNALRHIWLTECQSPTGVAFIEPVAMHEPDGVLTGNPGDFNLGGSWADKLSRYSGAKGEFGEMVKKMIMRPEYILKLLGKEKGNQFL